MLNPFSASMNIGFPGLFAAVAWPTIGDGLATTDALVVAAGVSARILVVFLMPGLPLLPAVGARIRLMVGSIVAVAIMPSAFARPSVSITVLADPLGSGLLVVLGEAVTGLVIGSCIAAVLAAGGLAGGMLAGSSGLSWAADFGPDPAQPEAGFGRLCWWIGVAAMILAGGLTIMVEGLLDSVQTLPIGSLVSDPGATATALSGWALRALQTGFLVAIKVALPLLVAVLVTNAMLAIASRAAAWTAPAGLLQTLAAIVALGGIAVTADRWTAGLAEGLIAPLEGCLRLVP
jgi:flagellar biosynthesis protein FliR